MRGGHSGLVATAVIVALIISGCGSSGTDKARGYIEAGMFSEAIATLEDVVKEQPTEWEAHYLLGVAYLNVGEESSAAESFDRCLRLNQNAERQITDAYYTAGARFLKQDTRSGVVRGITYFEVAANRDEQIRATLARECRDRCVDLVDNDPKLSRDALSRALAWDPSMKRDEEFFYIYNVLCARSEYEKLEAQEEYISLFSGEQHEAEVLHWLGEYYYAGKQYGPAKQYFSNLTDQYPGVDLAIRARARLDDISEIEQGVQQAERQKAEAIKKAEIEKAERLKQADIEHMEQLDQLEIEQAEKLKQLQIEEEERKKQQELADARRAAEQRAIVELLAGRWDFNINRWLGYLNIDVSGNRISGRMVFTEERARNQKPNNSISGSIDGLRITFDRIPDGESSGTQTYTGIIDPQSRRISGTYGSKGRSWYATKR